jgi:DNA polymerase V
VSDFASRVARRLRAQHGVCGAVHVFIMTSPYRKQDRQHSPTATLPLPRPSADTRVLVNAAVRALRAIYRPGHRYAKAGVMLVELQGERQAQREQPEQRQQPEQQARHEPREQASLDLFDEPEVIQPDGRRNLMATLDALNERFGRDAVGIASGARKSTRSTHASRQERRSPRYTTRLDEVIVAKA